MLERSEQDTRLFRFVVLAILLLIFVTVATIKIWELRVAAERIGVMHTVGTLKSALAMRVSELVLREGIASLEQLQFSNPMNLLLGDDGEEPPYDLPPAHPPSNYLGEFTTEEAPQAEGIWYFDTVQKMLIYRVRFVDHFVSSNPVEPDLIRYQLLVDYLDNNGNGRLDAVQDTVRGVNIEAIDDYTWLVQAKTE